MAIPRFPSTSSNIRTGDDIQLQAAVSNSPSLEEILGQEGEAAVRSRSEVHAAGNMHSCGESVRETSEQRQDESGRVLETIGWMKKRWTKKTEGELFMWSILHLCAPSHLHWATEDPNKHVTSGRLEGFNRNATRRQISSSYLRDLAL